MISQRKRTRKIKTAIGKGIDASGIALSVQGWNSVRNKYYEIHEQILEDVINIKLLKINGERLLDKICFQTFKTRNEAKRETNRMRDHRISVHPLHEDEQIWDFKGQTFDVSMKKFEMLPKAIK